MCRPIVEIVAILMLIGARVGGDPARVPAGARVREPAAVRGLPVPAGSPTFTVYFAILSK
jgi:hypothetical protein